MPLVSGNVADHFSGVFIDDHHVRAARNVNAMRVGIDAEIIPTAFAADGHSADHVIAAGLRRGEAPARGKAARQASNAGPA